MIISTNKDKGRAGLSLAIAYFGSNGYTSSMPLNDTQWYDLIVEKDGVFQTVQCKFTASKDNRVDFRSTGGTNGATYDNMLNHNCDLLFTADKDMNLFVIPIADLKAKGYTSSVTLKTEPLSEFANKNCMDTSKYLVKI